MLRLRAPRSGCSIGVSSSGLIHLAVVSPRRQIVVAVAFGIAGLVALIGFGWIVAVDLGAEVGRCLGIRCLRSCAIARGPPAERRQ